MQRHEFFNLFLDTTVELEAVLGQKLSERRTIHEWPLSCVQLLITVDGKRWICKSQFGPSVEPEFYTRAKSLLIPKAKILNVSALGHSNMLIEYIDAPLLKDVKASGSDVMAMTQAITKAISEIEGQLPYYLDVSTEEKWSVLMIQMIADLNNLESQQVNDEVIETIRNWAFSKVVLAVFLGEISYVHHDLSGTNIFVTAEGFKLIDWQRPIFAPKALDLAILLDSIGKDALLFVDEGIVWMMYLLRIHWFKECSLLWFPEGRQVYEDSIVKLSRQLGRAH